MSSSFFRFDGSVFTLADDIYVVSRSREKFFNGMVDVTEQLFSILLEGFIATLRAVQNMSMKRGQIGDISEHNSAMPGEPTPGGTRDSLDNWIKALLKAEEAQRILVNCDSSTLEAWESAGQNGLRLLEESVLPLPKIGSTSKHDWDAQELEGQIANILHARCK